MEKNARQLNLFMDNPTNSMSYIKLYLQQMAALVQVVEHRLAIKRLLNSGSILQLAMRCCVFRKDTSRLFPIGTK